MSLWIFTILFAFSFADQLVCGPFFSQLKQNIPKAQIDIFKTLVWFLFVWFVKVKAGNPYI